jgi:elongation factor Ts
MAITATQVKELRDKTGAGMMDCKKALAEADGDVDRAVNLLRKKGIAKAASKSGRSAKEGAIISYIHPGDKLGVLLELNCETDFVAKNADFVKFSTSILELALAEKPANLDALKSLPMGGKTVEETITEQSGTIGEKLELAYYDFIEAEKIQAYNHFGNNLATLVGFNKTDVDEQVAKDVAMQIAAMSPVAVDESDVPSDVIAKEKEIGREKALQEGKPENIVDRIAEGMVKKFLKENTLLNQEFTKDAKKTVGQYIKEADSELKVTAFKRFAVK